MKKIYRAGLMATAICLLLSLQGIAQDETPAPPPPPAKAENTETMPPTDPTAIAAPVPPPHEIIDDGNGVIIRQKGKKSAKITVELNGGDVRVNGKPISEFKDKNVSVSRIQPGALTITTDDDADVSMFRERGMNQGQLDNLQLSLDKQQRDVELSVEQAMRAQKMAVDLQNRKLSMKLFNEAYLGVGSKKSGEDGALVFEISSPSPAEKAGLKKGDVITKVDGKTIHNPDDLFKLIHEYKPGDKVKVTCKRDGKEVTVTAELEKSKAGQGYSYNYKFRSPDTQGYRGWNRDEFDEQPKLGLKAQDNDDGKGVGVIDVVAGSAAGKAGLKKGDNILRFDGDDVNSAEDLADHVRDARGKAKVYVSIVRDGKEQDIELHVPHKLRTEEL